MSNQDLFAWAYSMVDGAAWLRFLVAFDISDPPAYGGDMYTPERWEWAMNDPDWAVEIMIHRLRA